jgi:hypothetical protein
MSSVKITGGSISGVAISSTTGTFSGDLFISDKIVHDGDTNTSIRFPAADTVTVETAGSERLRVHASGGVSIGGLTDPGATNLSVVGTVAMTTLSIGGTVVLPTAAELNFVDGVTSAIQTQLDNRVTSNADDTLTGGYTTTAVSDGTPGSGSTYTPSPAGGNMRSSTTGTSSPFTFAPPTAAGDYTMVVQVTNAAGGGSAITLSGSWTRTTGSPFTTTANNRFIVYITKIGTATLANVVALQ